MNKIKEYIKDSPFLYSKARAVAGVLRKSKRNFRQNQNTRNTPSAIKKYLASQGDKLHIGCQNFLMEGWFNCDLAPMSPGVSFLDATKKFPFPNESFSFVFSEHMIEHVDFKGSVFMLKECYRVMKKNGILRISTPDLKFLIDLYKEEKSPLQKEYLEFCKSFINLDGFVNDTIVINNFYTGWEHKFIYDKKTMQVVLESIGFKNVTFCEVGKSKHSVLSNIEKHGLQIPAKFNELESFVVEAEKV